jgi:hypothetical protein
MNIKPQNLDVVFANLVIDVGLVRRILLLVVQV